MYRLLYLATMAVCLKLVATRSAPAEIGPGTSGLITEQQEEYLKRFYGLEPMSEETDESPSALVDYREACKEALRRLQHMAGLPETGVVDEETRKVMEMPRCGVSDVPARKMYSQIQEFNVAGSKWNSNDLTYKILNFSSDMSQADQESVITQAIKLWTEVTPLTFTRVLTGSADIEVSFATFDHGDSSPFDGPGGVLAHAYYPAHGGDVHMDDSESFTAFTTSGINMLQVMAHEFGHSLGLSHSNVRSALMAPFYGGYVPNFKLDQDDVYGIQSIYGRRSTSPDLCVDGQFDTITQYNKSTYAFRGSKYVRLNVDADSIEPGYPRNISSDFLGIPDDIDATLHLGIEPTYFFKGSQVWVVGYDGLPYPDYPKSISSEFPGLPDNIDAAFVWSGNHKIYFIKGSLYYRVTLLCKGVDAGYPQPLSAWSLPSKIDAAFQWSNGKTYFFSGSQYYLFNDEEEMVDQGNPMYPRPIKTWWLGCPSTD